MAQLFAFIQVGEGSTDFDEILSAKFPVFMKIEYILKLCDVAMEHKDAAVAIALELMTGIP